MVNVDTLYKELQADFDRLSSSLFEFAEQQVRKNGMFLPFGAILKQGGEITFEAATSGEEIQSCIEVLPMFHEGLRATVKQGGVSALAICEWVKITPEGRKQTDAMKVLVEHERGLTVAFYVPCRKSVFRGWSFEEMFAQQVEPEVMAWESHDAS
jgi:hypothetical protein